MTQPRDSTRYVAVASKTATILREATAVAREAQRRQADPPPSPASLELRARVRAFHGTDPPRCVVLTSRHTRCKHVPLGGAEGLTCSWHRNYGLFDVVVYSFDPTRVGRLFGGTA